MTNTIQTANPSTSNQATKGGQADDIRAKLGNVQNASLDELVAMFGSMEVAADGSMDGVGDAPDPLSLHNQIDRTPSPKQWEVSADRYGNHSVAADGSDGVGDAPAPDGSHRQIDYTK